MDLIACQLLGGATCCVAGGHHATELCQATYLKVQGIIVRKATEFLILASRLLLERDPILDLTLQLNLILLIIHLLDDALPLPFFDGLSHDSLLHLDQLVLCLARVSVLQDRLQKGVDSLLYGLLDESEFLVALVSEDFPKERHFVIVLRVALNPSNNSRSPLNNEVLQSIALVEVGVHVLLHGLLGQATFLASDIEFHLLRVHIADQFLQLL